MPDPPSVIAVIVVIVAYNAGEHLQRCIDALERQTFQDWRAIVWDNASTDGAVDSLRAGEKIEVVRCQDNLGFAVANNRAAARCPSRYIATLNPDAFAEPDWLERLVGAAETYGAESVASLQLDDADPTRLDGAGDCMSIAGIAWRGGYGQPRSAAPTQAAEVFSACAAAALYRRGRIRGARRVRRTLLLLLRGCGPRLSATPRRRPLRVGAEGGGAPRRFGVERQGVGLR